LKRLSFFPTPYPDEILYSVLCRYHILCGIPTARQTHLELWGKKYGKKLYLPDNIEIIAARIPQSANLTAERLINENTIFPLLKPFVTKNKSDALVKAMKFGDRNIYGIISFFGVFTMRHRYLRYCNQCIKRDIQLYGEPYWHRIHQLPGIYFCPICNVGTIDSDIALDDLNSDYYALTSMPDKAAQSFDVSICKKLLDLAHDTAWLLQHGQTLDSSEYTMKLYDNWLRVKKYRSHNNITSYKKLAHDFIEFYGKDFLLLLNVYDSGTCAWIRRTLYFKENFQHPLHHLLLIRFFADSAETFFAGSRELSPEYLPYGAPPYPCRNFICEFHLQDVIIDIENGKSCIPYVIFSCSHCGFKYKRSGKTPKEKQYTGQVHVVDYGHKWRERATFLLTNGKSLSSIKRELHCSSLTILKFGIEQSLLPQRVLLPEKRKKQKSQIPIDFPKNDSDFNTQREYNRQSFLELIEENPTATRNTLSLLAYHCYKWLKKNDSDWFELHAPSPLKTAKMWDETDNEYLEKIKNAVEQIRNFPGRPKFISIWSVSRKSGISNPYKWFFFEKLPKTKAFITENIETLEQWRKRKILWAVKQIHERGEVVTLSKVQYAACIAHKERKLDKFILECIRDRDESVASMKQFDRDK